MTTEQLLTPVSTPPAPRRFRPARAGSWAWIALSSLAIAAYSVSQYATGSLAALAEDGVGLSPGYAHQPLIVQIAFYLHIGFAGVALVAGPFQFAQWLRTRVPRVHRIMGRIYLVSVAIGGTAALVMAPFNTAGFVGFFGFGSLAVLWLFTGWKAYRSIRAGDVNAHQAWMIRNFSLTYAAVTLRLWIGVLITVQLVTFGGEFDDVWSNVYAAVPFLSWIPNIVVAELMVRRRGLPGLRWTR
ncbi:MAG: DUF2306 domain-containing protein [Rhodoglobus sp.]